MVLAAAMGPLTAQTRSAETERSGPAVAPHARPVVAVVLSGGSAFGLAHVGVLEAIEAAGIPIDMVVGTSMGAIVGGLYAAGYSPRQMESILAGLDWGAVFSDNRSSAGDRIQRMTKEDYALRFGLEGRRIDVGEGLLDGQSILALFTMLTAHCLDAKSFDQFPVRYRAVAADLMTGDKVVLGSGSLAEAMRSSMSIPGLFRPYELGGRLLVDGGVVDDLPVDVARAMGADVVIAVESRGSSPSSADDLRSPLDIAAQTTNLMILQNVRPSREAADILIKPELQGFTTASYPEARQLIERGKEAGEGAHEALDALASRISKDRALTQPDDQPNRRTLVQPPLISSVTIEGGLPENAARDAALVQASFSSVLGRPYAREDLKAAIDAIYASGNFNLVKVSLEPGRAGAVALVRLVPDNTASKAVFAGMTYSGLYSSGFSSSIELQTALFMQGLTGLGSTLVASATLVNAVGLEVSYSQPIGPLYVQPWLRYLSEYDTLSFSSLGVVVGSNYLSYGGGLWAGAALGKDSDIAVGYSLEGVHSADFEGESSKALSALRFGLDWDGRNSTAFPDRGLALFCSGRWAAPGLGSELSFTQVEALFDAALPIGQRGTIGVTAFAGLDFAGLLPGAEAEPSAFYSSLRHPGLFYGISKDDPSILADNAAALGLEYRHRVASFSPLFGRAYVFGNASFGAMLSPGMSSAAIPFVWCASGGMDLRISRNFGVQVALSLTAGTFNPLVPVFSVDIGNFLERPKERR
jgi:NTE family protein